MRTDSVNLSEESTAAAKEWLAANLGAAYAADAPRSFKSKSKLAQEAHEAIRPTNVTALPKAVSVEKEAERRNYYRRFSWRRIGWNDNDRILDGTSQHGKNWKRDD